MANYDTVKAGIVALLKGLGYAESQESVDFKNASPNEYGNRFILKPLSGENLNDTIIDRFDDEQEWQIQIAFARSTKNDIVNLDKAHRGKDAAIKALDKPANWQSFVKLLKYKSWKVDEYPSYYVLDIRLSILDIYTHG
jgi:hypothetical protein